MDDGPHHVFFYENSRADGGDGKQVSRPDKEEDVLRPFRDWFDSLTDSDQICWAYGILPSEYDDLANTEIWYDVTYRLRVRLGEVTVNHLQQHYSMVKVLSSAFGGDGKDKNVVKVNDMKSGAEAVSALNNFFGA